MLEYPTRFGSGKNCLVLTQHDYGSQVVNARPTPPILFHPQTGSAPVEWVIAPGLIDYPAAIAEMEKRVDLIAQGKAAGRIWLVEHPPLYTGGTSAKEKDLLEARFPVFASGRGGQYTYHGPGQRVAYAMLDLKRRKADVRAFVCALEKWLIITLQAFNIRGEQREDRVGVWVRRSDKGPDAEDKIAAIGIRVRRWVSFHGISININPDLTHFASIIPCGVQEAKYGVTSFVDLGLQISMRDFDSALRTAFDEIFGASIAQEP